MTYVKKRIQITPAGLSMIIQGIRARYKTIQRAAAEHKINYQWLHAVIAGSRRHRKHTQAVITRLCSIAGLTLEEVMSDDQQ